MPFAHILDDLVHRVDGAYGAVFLDEEGEAVCHATNGHGLETDTLNFIGARQGLLIAQLRRLAEFTAQGPPRSVTLAGERLTIVTQLVDEEYFLVLVIEPRALAARASFEMTRAVQQLRDAM